MPNKSEIERIAKGLSTAQKRNLLALPRLPDVWMTVSEMRPYGATGAGMDILHVSHLDCRVCNRRWTKWGDERGQKRGEGFEYRITPLGLAVRSSLQDQS